MINRRLVRLAAAVAFAGALHASAFAPHAHALTKESVPFDDDRSDEWAAGATCTIRYYNICTGWIWSWEFDHEERLGVVVEPCCGTGEFASLLQSVITLPQFAPCGRGFTGTIGVYAADANGCPSGPPLAIQPMCSYTVFTITLWDGLPVPSPFVLLVENADPHDSPVYGAYGTDHPAAGPTGPLPCGVCFPSDRVTRSFYYGTADAPLCPGEPFDDGVCNAELIWDLTFACATDVSESSWSKIKGLYR